MAQYTDTKILYEVEASIFMADQEVGLTWKWSQYAMIWNRKFIIVFKKPCNQGEVLLCASWIQSTATVALL